MGKEWDDPEKWKYPITKHGYTDGGERVAAPSIGSTSRNPNCRICKRHKRGWKDVPGCQCEKPDFDDRLSHLDARDKFIAWLRLVMVECLRVLKPGGHMLCWAIPRTSHWTATAIEEAGFEVRDSILHIFGCLSEDSEILTENGWEPYHKLVEGSLALCYDAERDTFQWQPIQQVYIYPYRDTAYRLRGDYTDQVVSRNHRCLVERGGAYAFEYAETLQPEEGVPVLEDVRGLLEALPLPHGGTGDSQQDVRPLLFGSEHRGQEIGASSTPSGLQGVRQGVLSEGGRRGLEGQVLRVRVQGQGQDGRSGAAGSSQGDCVAGSGGVDGRVNGVLPGEDGGREQPCMEGGCDVLLPSRELRLDEVRSVPDGVHLDGPQGRVCRGASPRGGASLGATSVEVGGGASRQPRPYGQPAGEFDALRLEPGAQAVRAARFTRTDLVRVEPIEYDGIVWCVRVPFGSFVARRAGKAFVTGNSGFPKSLNVGKKIDKAKGATRKIIKPGKGADKPLPEMTEDEIAARIGPSIMGSTVGINTPAFNARIGEVTEPATPEAKEWEGWGTQLKPAVEVWWLCRKPLTAKNVVGQVLDTGTGAINIDGTRIGTTKRVPGGLSRTPGTSLSGSVDGSLRRETGDEGGHNPNVGRWPANVVLSHGPGCRKVGTRQVDAPTINRFTDGMKPFGDGAGHPYESSGGGTEELAVYECAPGCPVGGLDEQSGELRTNSGNVKAHMAGLGYGGGNGSSREILADQGGASRFFQTFEPDYDVPFFYTGKASKKDKNADLEDVPPMMELREDLTEEERAFVVAELRAAGVVP